MLNKKVLLGVVVLGFSGLVAVNASAALPGAYVGGTAGWGTIHQDFSNIYGVYRNSAKDNGVAGRLFAGYQFDDMWAAELGWSKFSNADFTYSYNTFSGNHVVTGDIKTDAVDVVAKASFPIQDNFSLFGKAGIAYLMQRVDASNNSVRHTIYSDSAHRVYPTFTLGAAYDISPNVVADISWNRIQKVGAASNLNSTDLVGVGLSYNFG